MGIRVSAASLLIVCCAFGQMPSAKDIFAAIRENDAARATPLR
jgi:hypothetical protein